METSNPMHGDVVWARCRTTAGTAGGIVAGALAALLGVSITVLSWHKLLGRYFGETTGTQIFLVVVALVISAVMFGAAPQELFVVDGQPLTLRRRYLGVISGRAKIIPATAVESVLVKRTDAGWYVQLRLRGVRAPLNVAEGTPEGMTKLAERLAGALGTGPVTLAQQ